jgi:hypothetical protein
VATKFYANRGNVTCPSLTEPPNCFLLAAALPYQLMHAIVAALNHIYDDEV